ncbi:MAG: tetratricopeptide repeat protein [Alphaproteobacteria bacterium]
MKLISKSKNIFNAISRFFLSLVFLCTFSNISLAQQTPETVVLTYGEHEKFDRFVFKTDKKIPSYKISQNGALTSIVFDGKYDIKSSNAQNYPRYKAIRNELLDNDKTRFIIPAQKLKNFEIASDNKIVIDVKSYKEPQNEQKAPVFIVNEVKVVDEIKPSNELSLSKEDEASLQLLKDAKETSQMPTEEIVAPSENLSVEVTNSDNQKSLLDGKENRRSVSLSFSWSARVGMASFIKNDYLWIVFDESKGINTTEIADLTKGYIFEIVQLPHPTATILRLKLQDNIYASIRKEGLLWVVDLFNQKIDPRIKNLDITVNYASQNNAYIYVPTNNAGNIVMTYDPEIGDILMIAPVYEPRYGVSKNYKYPEFDILESLQGFVIEPLADDIILTRNNSGLTVKGLERGLSVSPNISLLKKQSALLQQKDWIKNLSNDLPMNLVHQNYISTYADLMERIENADEENKTERRLELAKYFNAKGLGTNAIGILQDIIASGGPLANREDVHGQLGISYFLTQRYDQAIQELSFGRLKELNEADFWRTLSKAAKLPLKEYNKVLASFIPVIREYPDELKLRVAMTGVEVAVVAGDDVTAQSFLDVIQTLSTKRKIGAFVDYWSFEVLSIQGYSQTAMARLRSAAMSSSAKYSAYARKKLTMLDYKSDKISKKDAIDELERLKYVWGEDKFKMSLLEDLYDIYVSSGDYYNALKNMQELLKFYKDSRKDQLTTEMVSIFENIFINNNEGNLTAIQSLALFNDFEWLTQNSENYTQIIINLADRLVSVDLLGRADNLLRKYVSDKNIDDKNRALIGSRLALINIFSEQYLDALRFLDETQSSEIPDFMKAQRKLIRAKALIGLGKYNEAINLLKDENSMNAIVIKSDLYWRTEQWALAAENLKKQIVLPQEGEKLSDEQASIIIDWITALKKDQKDTMIVLVKDKFAPYFTDSKYHSAFNVLTNSASINEIDLKNLNQFIRDVDTFRNFAQTYNEALGSNSYIEVEKK